MNPPIRLLIHGASGRMGRALLRLAGEDPGFIVVAAISRSGTPVAEAGRAHMFSTDTMEQVPAFDVAVDFSLAPALEGIVALCEARGAALVSGTTGLEASQSARLDLASHRIALTWAANFSLGVAVLSELVQRAAALLPEWDFDIVESHHVHKRDAPSGTALALGAAAQRGGAKSPRYASLRAGDIVGEHAVQFTGLGERIELVHRATHRDLFARGALAAAKALAGRGPGRHELGELLFDG